VDPANFLFLCRCLSVDHSPAAIATLREEMRAGEVDWRQIAQLAADYFLTPALWVSLSRKGLKADLPEDARDFLQYVHGLNVERNKSIKAQVLQIASRLNQVGVEPILLKGAVHLFDSAYGDLGARMMRDVDILVSEDEIERVLEVLAELGYRPTGKAWHPHMYSVLCRPGETWSFDLHRYLGYQRDIVAPGDVRREAVTLEADGLKLRAPSPTHQVFHNMHHAQLQNQCHVLGLLPLMQLYDFAALCRHHTGAVDWTWLRAIARTHGLDSPLRAYVHSAVELFGLPRPCAIPVSVRAKLHHRRCLAQLRHPMTLYLVQQLGGVTGAFRPLHVRDRYGCGTNPLVITFLRLRLVYDVFREHGWRVVAAKINELRRFDPGQYR
jgi:hypothetical protein